MTENKPDTSSKCLFLVAEKGKWGINDHLKPFKAIYNGIGWFVEEKYQHEIEQISQQANMRLLEWPLVNQSFDDLRTLFKKGYLHEKSLKLKIAIDGLKATLGIENLNISQEDIQHLKQTPEGKKLVEHIEKYDFLKEQIQQHENEEKIKKIQLIDSQISQPYTLDDLQNDLANTKEGLKTGFKELDEMVRIPNAAITLIGGRPSHGKTTFMLNLFVNLIKQYPDLHFYFFSYEETRQQIAIKIINILSGYLINEAKNILQLEGYIKGRNCSIQAIENGKKEYQELVSSGRLRIIGEPYHVHELSSQLARLKKSQIPLGAVFIDYIQKIKNKNRFGTRQLELQKTSEVILETAKFLSIPIILGAQLGRDKDSRDKVKLDNLREAGDLEQDANLVLGLFNPSMEKAQDEQSQLTARKVDLKVTPLKNRNGIVNKTISLEFDRPILTIKDKA